VKKRSALRADTTVAPAGEPQREVYVREIPTCCIRSLKEAALREAVGARRSLALDCSCGRSWWITSSLDERILERFVTHGGPRAGGVGDGPSAA
jgi:hypothetical protein